MSITKTRRNAGIALMACLAAAGFTSAAKADIVLPTADFTMNANGYSSSTASDGTVETWGIFQLVNVNSGSTSLFDDGLGTEYWGVFYGSLDVLPPTPGFDFSAEGMKLDLYEVNTLDVGNAQFQAVATAGEGGRIGTSGYTGISDVGTLVFSAEAVGRVETILFPSGSVGTAGVLASTFNDLFTYGTGFEELLLAFGITNLGSNPVADWDLHFTSTIDGTFTPIPEPSTYGLIGALALLGVVAYRRRSKKAAALPAAA